MTSKPTPCRNFAGDRIRYFLCDSSIHGFKYLGQDRSIFERVFWTVSVLVAVGMSIYLIQVGVIGPLMANPVIITFQEKEITVDKVPFPAFTICNSNQFKRTPYLKLLREYDEARKELEENSEYFWSNMTKVLHIINLEDSIYYMTNYCASSESFSEHFANTTPGQNVNELKNVNENSVYNFTWVRNVANKIFHSCDDMILACAWRGAPTPCSKLFYPIRTEFGYCCSFNMIPMPNLRRNAKQFKNFGDRKIRQKTLNDWKGWNIDEHLAVLTGNNKLSSTSMPQRQIQAGLTSGLSILLNPELNEHYSACKVQESAGFRIEAHSPIDCPHVTEFGKTVHPNSETFVAVQAEISIVDDDVRKVSKEKRQCYFVKERWLSSFNFYTQKNCIDECVMNITFSTCKCVRQYMPRNINQTICRTMADRSCVKGVKKMLTTLGLKSSCKDCLPSCTQVTYISDTSRLPIRNDINLWTNFTTGENMSWANVNLSIVHVFMIKDNVQAKQRKALYGFQEVLANAGGLLGLGLGISMISLVEPVYFLTLRLWFTKNSFSKADEQAVVEKKKHIKKFNPMKILVNPHDFARGATVQDVNNKDPGISNYWTFLQRGKFT